ncbi:MAG: hypothetical protein Greene041619_522 [Candidatus Peregrinibacteria bacterium Greene0416_19]|nr:MAG: hypothetical protein Greene041619_522 [Candidatus Peregrinibacteria bacterium Greene0416_19]
MCTSACIRRLISILTILTTATLAACGGEKLVLYNLRGQMVGEVRRPDGQPVVIIDSYGSLRGRVRDHVITDADDRPIGTVSERERETLILNEKGTDIGTVQDNRDCYDRDDRLVGRMSVKTDPDSAAAACVLLILKK